MLKAHQDIIISNLSILIEETDLTTLVPELISRNVFNKRMIERILNPLHNTKRQKTDLYIEILKRGPQAFSKLRDALLSTNHLNIFEILWVMDTEESTPNCRPSSVDSVNFNLCPYSSDNGSESDGPCHSIQSKTSCEGMEGVQSPNDLPPFFCAKPGHSGAERRDPNRENKDLNDEHKVSTRDGKDKVFNLPAYNSKSVDENLRAIGALTPEDRVVYSTEKNLPVSVKNATQWQLEAPGKPHLYKMDSNPRGCALVVNNMKFYNSNEYPDRVGCDNDLKRFTILLNQLHFVVESHENKTKKEMEEIVKHFAQKPELENVDCVWVTFMSHGEEGDSSEDSVIVGVDGLGYKTSDIVSCFYNDNCKACIEKPKIFFFQACRGCLADLGVTTGFINISKRVETDGKKIQQVNKNVRIRTYSDIFIAYPSPEGIMANRDRVSGAWFIQKVVDVFGEYAWNTHLEDLLKMVDDKIKRMNNLYSSNFQAVTTKSIGWNKHLFFNPGMCRDKATGETRFIANLDSTPELDEGMDVVDVSSSNSDKSPNGIMYLRLKDDKDGDSEDNSDKCDCFNLSICKTS